MEDLNKLRDLSKDQLSTIYQQLETLCLLYPGRVTGSKSLEKAIDFLYEDTKKSLPVDCCKKEEVANVTRWVRYGNFGNYCYESRNEEPSLSDLKSRVEEKCFITIKPNQNHPTDAPFPYPANRQVKVLANGLSVGTGPEGVVGEVVVISSWEELREKGDEGKVHGKIVLYDYILYTDYGDVTSFRYLGAERAAKHGAVAVIIRSLTPNDSLSGAHTGVQSPEAPIPSVCIAIEDCEMMRRLIERGYGLESTLILPCTTLPPTTSHNLLFEMKGSEKPEEIVLIGGHVDCWDCQYGCCQGAHDDGQAVVICIEIIKLLHRHNLRPRRTIRAVVFTDEELLLAGGDQYEEKHRDEADRVVAAIETDSGVGPICGFNYETSQTSFQRLQSALKPLDEFLLSLSSSQTLFEEVKKEGGIRFQHSYVGADITPMMEKSGIPGLLVKHSDDWERETYFHFHHSSSDSIDHIDKDRLYENFFFLLGAVWLIANSDDNMLRE
eukprot:gene16602-18891_t